MVKQIATMPMHMQKLINFLTKNELKKVLEHYMSCSEAENVVQIAFLFQQGQIKNTSFDFYQQLATKFIESKGFPDVLIRQVKSNELLNFFTPALQLKANFNKVNSLQRNVLHYLFAGEQKTAQQLTDNKLENKTLPPFNYLRSMMLFESNELIHLALCQRDKQDLTPVETYLFTNQNLTALPNHELSAFLALIEMESKKQKVATDNYTFIIQAVRNLCIRKKQLITQELQRLVLIAAYYSKQIQQVVIDINLKEK